MGIGMNNVGNAMAAVVGGGYLDLTRGTLLGGLLMGTGGLLWGSRVVSTTAREITALSPLRALLVCAITATLTVSASLMGLPTSYVQTSTLAVVGIGASQTPFGTLMQQAVIRRIGFIWLACPALAFVAGFSLM